ncbi:MAG: alpha/beta hydrolase [Myxococcales bacterium]|nr:alpha/beta hydrolase [Myxococcales bacterium]
MRTTALFVASTVWLVACSDAESLGHQNAANSVFDTATTGADLSLGDDTPYATADANESAEIWSRGVDVPTATNNDTTDSQTNLDLDVSDAEDTPSINEDVGVIRDVSASTQDDTSDTQQPVDINEPPTTTATFEDWEQALNTNDLETLITYLSTYDMPVCKNGFCWIFTYQPSSASVEMIGEFNGWADGTKLEPVIGLPNWYYGKIEANFDKVMEYQLKVNGQWTRDETNRYIRFGPFGFNSAIYSASYGRITALWQVQSMELGNYRDVYVYLPASYFSSPNDSFPVLYLQDGFNVYENPKAPFGSWNVDVSADVIFAEKTARPTIFVAIDTQDRVNEYLYTAAALPGGSKATPKLDLYAAFVVNTLKPIVDSTFRTKPDRDYTAIAGSSLGGISSAYIAWNHSETFGAAASFSGSFWVGENGESGPAFREIISTNSVKNQPGAIRYYLDSGDTPFGQNASYQGDSWVYTDWTRNALISAGWDNRPEWDTDSNLTTAPVNLSPTTAVDQVPSLAWAPNPPEKYVGWKDYLGWDSNLCCLVGHGHSHNEGAWEQRFGAALRFLFPPKP